MTSIAGLLLARQDDDHVAVLDGPARWSWRQTVAAGAVRAALAGSLMDDGPPHIGVLLPNVAEYLLWLSGAALSGMVVVGLNPTRRGEALAADVRATDCALIVTDTQGAAQLADLDLGQRPVLDIDQADYGSALGVLDGNAVGAVMDGAGSIGPDALFLLLFTSGTTGTPKAVRCTQGRLAGIAEVAAPGYGYNRDSVCYCAMPLFHGNSLMALWAPALYAGSTVALRDRFSASGFLDDVRRYGATTFNYVGKSIAYILATPERPDDADNPLKTAFGTEASLRDRKRFAKRFGCYLIEGYGQSEGGAAINPVPGMPPGALGLAAQEADLAVLDPESGDECPRATFDGDGALTNAGAATGELVNRGGRGRFEGYYGAPEAEAERLRHGWYWTGDLAYRDGAGFFYFAGRRGDWLRVDSENFAAGPVEAVLSRHPDVSVAAVYGVPDPRSGDQVMAALELAPGASLDPDAFATWLAQQADLGTKWAPRFVRVTPAIPQTGSGKVTKVDLQAEAWWAGDDPVWWRPPRDRAYRRLTDADRAGLRAEAHAHGQTHRLGGAAGG